MTKMRTITLTHTEVLSLAIRSAHNDWQRNIASIEKMEEKDPAFAAELRRRSTTTDLLEKLKTLLWLYKLETGTDYGLDIFPD